MWVMLFPEIYCEYLLVYGLCNFGSDLEGEDSTNGVIVD